MSNISHHFKKIHKSIAHREIAPGLSSADFLKILTLRTIGNFLILLSIYMLGWVFYKPILEEIKYFANQVTNKKYILVEQKNDPQFKLEKNQGQGGLLSGILSGQNVEVLVPTDPNFSIVIPKLGANAKVVPNVSTANKNQYLDALKQGVAHAEGTKFPGEKGHIYMFAHSTNTFSNVSRYNAVFYLLYKLENDDEIDIYYKGVRYKYLVTGKEIVDPSQTQYLTRKTTSEFLTLQTCWPPGTIAKRMLIFAEPYK